MPNPKRSIHLEQMYWTQIFYTKLRLTLSDREFQRLQMQTLYVPLIEGIFWWSLQPCQQTNCTASWIEKIGIIKLVLTVFMIKAFKIYQRILKYTNGWFECSGKIWNTGKDNLDGRWNKRCVLWIIVWKNNRTSIGHFANEKEPAQVLNFQLIGNFFLILESISRLVCLANLNCVSMKRSRLSKTVKIYENV